MTVFHRVLSPEPVADLADHLRRRGGEGLEAAASVAADTLIAEVEASGLRGRGGAGFPTGRKWRTVAGYRSPVTPTTVVVNGAEGEPGTVKARTIIRRDPYRVIEGAVIAARAVGGEGVVFAVKRAFGPEVARLRAATGE